MAALLPQHCALCGRRENLLRCAGCQVVYYCGRDHQTTDWKAHKGACSQTTKAHRRFAHEESLIRDVPQFGMGWTWEDSVGRFWGILETRDYMRARYGYVVALLAHNTVDGVERAVEHELDMLRLCRSDNMGIRNMAPHLLLRLGRDQEAYDFLKWWATTGNEGDYDWGDMSHPHLNLKGENAFEKVEGFFDSRYGSLNHKLVATLLKIRLWLELRDVRNADIALRDALPRELLDMIKTRVVRSDVVARRQDLIEHTDRAGPEMRALQKQIRTMINAVRLNNEFMLPRLFAPNVDWNRSPQSYSMGSREEAQLTLNYCYLAWAETPGAIDVAKKALAAVRAAS
ncbi:MYND finger [Colletotrichum plurivorum]|uniref:MYND finger n=1 Tax=Colletotrichum plurivorum TaxID=2175906 RepID=A0A8H6KG65_9PEZI|nr:MYND finger [Colletotrichum plurivorum]